MTNPENLESSTPYAMYWWDCPHCYDTNDARDIEPSGVEVCQSCNEKVLVST